MERVRLFALCAALILIFTGCLAHGDTLPTETGTEPPVLTVTQNPEAPAEARQELLSRYGGGFSLRRSFGMEQIRFKFDENSVERMHFDSMKDDVPTHTGTWDILNGELIITGQWNETFLLDLDNGTATSKADGEEYRISGNDNSLTLYGDLQDTVLTYGPGGEFCVSDFRQNQEYHVINVHDGAYSPWLQLSRKVGAVCAPCTA